MKLMAKLFIDGKIKALTGLHIGGSKTDIAIGDIDNSVIKTTEGVPYIPGSSLKGKLRSLLEKKEQEKIKAKHEAMLGRKKEEKSEDEENKKDPLICKCGKKDCEICVIFGSAADKRTKEAGPTRLIVRDCHLSNETRRKMENREGEYKELDLFYTESKWENLIDRTTSRADHPRQTERVPQGAEFDFQMIFNIMELEDVEKLDYLFLGLSLLEDDYLGGNGSRGYGRVEFNELKLSVKTITDYEEGSIPQVLYSGNLKEFSQDKKTEVKEILKEKLGAE
jgi:CRISPR-associated protein Csm3